MRRAYLTIFILLGTVSLVFAENQPLRFAPHWLPQAQFAGFYVASDQGFYEEAGLDVEIIHPTANINVIDYLEQGTADVISQFLITAITGRDRGVNMVNIAQFSQHSAILFVSKKSSNINTLDDFDGKRIGVWRGGFREAPMAMIMDHDLEVEWVPILSTVNLFLEDGVDLMTMMWYNEYNQIYLSGLERDELNTFFLSDYGFDVPEDGLYTLKTTREERQEDLQAFTEATLQGWQYAAENRDYTVELVVEKMREAHIPANEAHQRWMLDKVLEMQQPGDKDVVPGELHPDDFRMAVNILQERGMLERKACDYNNFFMPVLPGIQ
ncbi:MAG: ABC transporter substrate-binding protein [Bacteroidota bacterium]